MLISPLKTLKIVGNSSRSNRRRILPTRVTGGSLLTAILGPFSPGSKAIVRNLSISNNRASLPIRLRRKNTGPGELSLISTAIASNSGKRTTSKMPDVRMSKTRLTAASSAVSGDYLRNGSDHVVDICVRHSCVQRQRDEALLLLILQILGRINRNAGWSAPRLAAGGDCH